MKIKTTVLTITAAAMIAGSAFSFASAASRDLGDNQLQDGYSNTDGSKVGHNGFGYSMNQSPVSKLQSGAGIYVNQPTNSSER